MPLYKNFVEERAVKKLPKKCPKQHFYLFFSNMVFKLSSFLCPACNEDTRTVEKWIEFQSKLADDRDLFQNTTQKRAKKFFDEETALSIASARITFLAAK